MIAKYAISKTRGSKIKYLLHFFIVFICVLLLRLFYLQIENGGMFASLGEKNFLRMEIIPPLRGDVYDCNQILLAANRPIFDLHWHGAGRSLLSEHDRQILEKISKILDFDFLQNPKRRTIEYAERYSRRVLLKADVNFAQLCQISEQCSDAQRLVVSNRFKRVYPHNTLASHILGYLNKGEGIGQSGIEHHFQAALQGQEGKLLQVINSKGKLLAQEVYKEPQAGSDITLTLDFKLQQLAETLFQQDQSGAFILMDATDGSIRALVSYPHFNPNVFLNPLSEEAWSKLTENNPLINRATSAHYPPASTFKLVTLAAGLEEDVIQVDSEVQCNGYITFCGRKYFCIKHLGHGKLTPKQAIAVSCNITCFHIAKKLNIDQLAEYARRFGLGRKTNFLLPEKSGLVPTIAWKRAAKGERWWKGETLSACIGQGYLLATPLQIACMVSSICTSSLVRPRLLEQEPIENEVLNISQPTLTFLREAMKEAVDNGSARNLRRLKAFDVYAKTGTAQTCSLDHEQIYKHQLEHGWVVGYFYYKNNPRPLTFIAFVEHAGSSRPAMHIVDKFLRGYKTLMEETEQDSTDAKN